MFSVEKVAMYRVLHVQKWTFSKPMDVARQRRGSLRESHSSDSAVLLNNVGLHNHRIEAAIGSDAVR